MKKPEPKACRLLNIYKGEGRDVVTSLFCCLRFAISSNTGATFTAGLRPFFAVYLFLFCGYAVVNGYKFTERDGGGVVWCRFAYAFHYYSTLNMGETNLRHFFESSGTFLF